RPRPMRPRARRWCTGPPFRRSHSIGLRRWRRAGGHVPFVRYARRPARTFPVQDFRDYLERLDRVRDRHRSSSEGSFVEALNDGQNAVRLTLMDEIDGPLAIQQAMLRVEPKPGF